MIQEILAFTALGSSIVFIIKKFFHIKKRPSKNCGDADCGCK